MYLNSNSIVIFTLKFCYLVVLITLISCDKNNDIEVKEIETLEIKRITSTSAIAKNQIIFDNNPENITVGVCWSESPEPSASDNSSTDRIENGVFYSHLTGLNESTKYFVRPYYKDNNGANYGKQISFTTFSATDLPVVTTAAAKDITSRSAIVGGNIISHGGTEVNECGVFYASITDPLTNGIQKKADSCCCDFEVILGSLDPETEYYVISYAKNDSGISYGEQISFKTTDESACSGISPPSGFGIIAFDDKCWLDRNLGAHRVATSHDDPQSFGFLYQWGREADGHELQNSLIVYTKAPPGEQPNHSDFIANDRHPFDWNSDNNWNYRWVTQNGNTLPSDPCPPGWRVPTRSEWQSAKEYGNWKNKYDAFNSSLKLPSAGKRDDKGVLYYQGVRGQYWSSSYENIFGTLLNFYDNGAFMQNYYRVGGMSVRCIKDN